jgi:uncharacterized glyoxalase superfamily protein PhnB
MKLASVRLVAADIQAMVAFYEMATDLRASWLAPVFAEIVTPAATLAIGSAETVAQWRAGSAEPRANRTAVVEFQVDDLEADYARLRDRVPLVHELKTMPWGTRTFQFRDPEGTLVSLYMPVTEEARRRFASR